MSELCSHEAWAPEAEPQIYTRNCSMCIPKLHELAMREIGPRAQDMLHVCSAHLEGLGRDSCRGVAIDQHSHASGMALHQMTSCHPIWHMAPDLL